MLNVARIMMLSDIVTDVWLIDFCFKATKYCGFKSRLRYLMAAIKVSLRKKYTRGQSRKW